MPEIDGLHHLSLTVRDVESSTAWYERVLGLTRAFAHADDVQGWTKVQLIHPASGMRLSFTQHKANRGDAFSELRTGMDHLAFRVADRAELEAWAAHLADQAERPGPRPDVPRSGQHPTGSLRSRCGDLAQLCTSRLTRR